MDIKQILNEWKLFTESVNSPTRTKSNRLLNKLPPEFDKLVHRTGSFSTPGGLSHIDDYIEWISNDINQDASTGERLKEALEDLSIATGISIDDMLVGSEYDLIENANQMQTNEVVFGNGPLDSEVKGGWDFGEFENEGKKIKGARTFMGISYYVLIPSVGEETEDKTPTRRRRFDG